MRKLLPLTLVILTSTYVSTASADNNWYIGASYSSHDVSIPGRNFNTAGILAGYQFTQHLALETRLATGTSGYSGVASISEDEYIGDYSEDIDTQASISLKASYPLLDSLSIYALAGFTQTRMDIDSFAIDFGSDNTVIGYEPIARTFTESGLSYGIGLNYQLSRQFSVFVDYQVLPDFEPASNFSASWKTISAGVSYSF